jgi:hypothetical protein
MEALLGVKSVAQMIELQTGYFRKQAEMMADQAKTMQGSRSQAGRRRRKADQDSCRKGHE